MAFSPKSKSKQKDISVGEIWVILVHKLIDWYRTLQDKIALLTYLLHDAESFLRS